MVEGRPRGLDGEAGGGAPCALQLRAALLPAGQPFAADRIVRLAVLAGTGGTTVYPPDDE